MPLAESLRGLVRTLNFSLLGVPAVVTVPGGSPVPTLVIWLSPITEAEPGPNLSFQRSEPRRVMAIRRDEVPEVPRGTVVAVTEPLLITPTLWVVDEMDKVTPDHHRVAVLPAEEGS